MEDPLVACNAVHVWITCWAARKGSVQASVRNEKNVLSCLEGMLFIWVFCISVLCFVSIILWFTHFLQSYVLLCNWLFSRPQTFLSEECSVLWNSSVSLLSVTPFALVWVAVYIFIFFFLLFCLEFYWATPLFSYTWISCLAGLFCVGPVLARLFAAVCARAA